MWCGVRACASIVTWNRHIESEAIMLGTACNYAALRLLGLSPNDPLCVGARAFIQKHGS